MSNLSILTTVARGLGHLCPSVVFVGGAVTELYAIDGAAPEVRTTAPVLISKILFMFWITIPYSLMILKLQT